MTDDNFCIHFQNRLFETSQTGGQWYSDTSPFSIPWFSCQQENIFNACALSNYLLSEKIQWNTWHLQSTNYERFFSFFPRILSRKTIFLNTFIHFFCKIDSIQRGRFQNYGLKVA
jgi:hypothetical protein